MSGVLKSKAASSLNKGHPSSFYSSEKQNPVLLAFDQEFAQFVAYVKKRSAPGYKIPTGEANSRPADILFELWNKYEPRLPKLYYQQKLLEMGDFLVSIQEFPLALWQCYDRYLHNFGEVNVEDIKDVDIFRQTFFPSGFDADGAGLTFRALMGKSISMYQVVRLRDLRLQNKQSVEQCVRILGFLRLVMQVVLPKESLCWLIFNGTVHIYSMSRHLMSMGYSSRVLEYLLWAAMCMETSVPLMALKYLQWRATLYTAVCQCYYDCKAGVHAEAFARRGLARINELSQLEIRSCSVQTLESSYAFRQATIKMAVMVYKRAVFETRRRPKGLLRPKTRANLKEALNLPWPRTPTEKMLVDMFEGGSAQFLAILESLTDTNRRILLTSPPAQDSEPEILDVYVELFLAALEILAGGGGNRALATRTQMQLGSPPLTAVVSSNSLIDLASRGEDGIPLNCAIRIVKLAYNFEHWEVFDFLLEPVLACIKEGQGDPLVWEEKALELLQAMGHLNSSRKPTRRAANAPSIVEGEQEEMAEEITSNPAQSPETTHCTGLSMRSMIGQDELVNLADVLMSIVNGPFKQEQIEVDMVVDAALFLWSKCKAVFQKFQTGSIDNHRYLQKMENPHKWIYLLDTVHQSLGWTGISSIDPTLTAEVVLRLAMVCETSAQLEILDNSKPEQRESKTIPYMGDAKANSHNNLLSQNSRQIACQQLTQALEILKLGLKNVNYARTVVALNDGKSIADIGWIKKLIEDEAIGWELHPDIFQAELGGEDNKTGVTGSQDPDSLIPSSRKGSATAVWNTVKDLHLELILVYHRIALKLASLTSVTAESGKDKHFKKSASGKAVKKQSDSYIQSVDKLKEGCGLNLLSKALLLMQQALMLGTGSLPTKDQKALLNEAVEYIQKVEMEERRIYFENSSTDKQSFLESQVPPPPILLCRTNQTMVFRPAAFVPVSGEKVAWYRLFGRNAEGSNVKVRLNDYYLPGTGDEVPSYGCELKVFGLKSNERYMFAVAAYTADGTLIGNSIGETTKPILASHPLPVLMTWAFLSQISYQLEHYPTAKKACEKLWDHFVSEPPPPVGNTVVTEIRKDFKLSLLKLNQRAVCLSSPVLLRQFLNSIFIIVDINIHRNGLFCDVLTDQGPLYLGQIKRLSLCEKLLVAIELAGWLNEASLALQAVVQCYGLVAPLLFYRIPALPVIQLLQRCHAVLQEIPAGLMQKRMGHIADSLMHMAAVITYQLSRVLRSWGQRSLARSIVEAGRRLLIIDGSKDSDIDLEELAPQPETGTVTLETLKKKGGFDRNARGKEGGGGRKSRMGRDEESPSIVNKELKALEAHTLKTSQAAQGEHELSGHEDLNILHTYIAYLPSKMAYREVSKFKKRAQYLEFFVQVAQKALTEGEMKQVIEWCDSTAVWLTKRNENIIGPRAFIGKQIGAVTVAGSDPKKFAAAVAEYSKKGGSPPRKTKEPAGAAGKAKADVSPPPIKRKPRRQKYKAISVTANMSEAERQLQEKREIKAMEVLNAYFLDLHRKNTSNCRLRRITADEMPWRSQLNMVHGLSHFGVLLNNLERREKLLGSSSSNIYRTSFLDHEWFSFETAGTLVVGWDGGPACQTLAQGINLDSLSPGKDRLNVAALNLATDDRPKTTGIEFAAAAATGRNPTPQYSVRTEEDATTCTYRSEYSRQGSARTNPDSMLLSTETTVKALTSTFSFFKRAVVLAHRGHHWTLLQNSARALWNCLHTVLIRALTLAPKGKEPGLLTMSEVNDLAWQSVHMATDCLLDMLVVQEMELKQQADKIKSRGRQVGRCFESWLGDITMERGGSNLKFEHPLDNLAIIDGQWVRRLVLHCLEMLYYQEKWEKLVDIALRFNAISNDRYAEQVVPLLVQAQRKVEARIAQVDGPDVPQPHYRDLTEQLGHLVTARDYLTIQLQVYFDPDRARLIQPGTQIDPMGHNAYSEEDAFRLSSVPLDTSVCLESLQKVLAQSRYTARALQHCRKLLVLYLAGQQNLDLDSSLSWQTSKVDFASNTARPQPIFPPDLTQEMFLSVDDVETPPIPRSQLSLVITSYEKTIEMLLAKNQKGLAAQALQELGNVHYHTANIRAAYKCWAESLDLVLGMTNALRTWRQESQAREDISCFLLERCGLWGCLMGAVVAANIAQYILTTDLGHRMECCFLSGHLFKALFRASLPHPTADCDYALYDVGEGCEVTNLMPGIDFLSDRFRSNGRSVVAALHWVTEEMARGKHNLFVLPLLTLAQYFSTFVCRDVQRSVDSRILKVRVLTDLGFFSEAITVLQQLLHGKRLPHTGDSSFRYTESHFGSEQFNNRYPINELTNMKVLEKLLDKRLPSSLATLFGPHMTCHLSLAHSHLLTALAETIPVLPAKDDVLLATDHSDARTINTHLAGVKPHRHISPPLGRLFEDRKDDDSDDFTEFSRRLSDKKGPPTLDTIKATLLIVADQMVTSISDVICENASNEKEGLPGLAAAELELVVLCRLEQAAIAQQKHHAPMAARIALSAIQLLRNSHVFQPKKRSSPQLRPSSIKGSTPSGKTAGAEVKLVNAECVQFQYQNFQCRARLDARLWLTCRRALVRALNMEIRGMGEVKGPENKVLTELAECRQYCLEGLKEAEACGDAEVQAEFLFQGALLNIMEGQNLEQTISILDDAVNLFRSVSCLSLPAEELLVSCLIVRTDLQATLPSETLDDGFTQEALRVYLEAQNVILKQMETLGEHIERHLPIEQLHPHCAPISPMGNIYTAQVLLLAQLKLRVGHTMARILAKEIKNRVKESSVEQWVDCLSVLSTGLEVMHVCARREATVEAEMLLTIGRVQKMLVFQGNIQPAAAAATFLDAIKVSYSNDHDLGLIHQAYLELALIYLYSSGSVQVKEGFYLSSVKRDSGDEPTDRSKSLNKEKKQLKSKKEPMTNRSKEEQTQIEQERKAAWIAVRSAAATAQAMRARGMILGDSSVTMKTVEERLPDFAALDMMSPYVLGEKKKVFKNEIEEELAPLIEAQEVKVHETYEEEVSKARAAASDLSLIPVLGYQTILQRLCCAATIAASSSPANEEFRNEGEEETSSTEFDLGFIGRTQFDMGLNYDVVRYMLFSGLWSIRLNRLHQYLCCNLPQYARDCCAIYPPSFLLDLSSSTASATIPSNLDAVVKSYVLNLPCSISHEQEKRESNANTENLQHDQQVKPPPAPGCREDLYKPSDTLVLTSSSSDVTIQWYQPVLAEADPAHTAMNSAGRQILLMYALFRKGVALQSSISAGLLWVSLYEVNALHDRLAAMAQRAEISLVGKAEREPGTGSSLAKSKRPQRIRALSPKLQRDEHLQSLLQQCLDNITDLLGSLPDPEASLSVEIPFEVSKQNLKNLEELFDATRGMMVSGTDLVDWLQKLLP